jgi:hypothetical protein
MLFREVFEWLGVAKAFLRLVLAAPILAKLDLDRLTVEPRDFLSVIFKETRADYEANPRGRFLFRLLFNGFFLFFAVVPHQP